MREKWVEGRRRNRRDGVEMYDGQKNEKTNYPKEKTPMHHHAVYHTYNMRGTKINTGPSMDCSVEGIYQIGDSTCHPSFHIHVLPLFKLPKTG